jgi:hypothetical protein
VTVGKGLMVEFKRAKTKEEIETFVCSKPVLGIIGTTYYR